NQWLIRQLFWNHTHQRRIAVTLHVSQQEVSKRKARLLRSLRRMLNCHSRVFSEFLTFWWVLLDGVDLLSGIDLLHGGRSACPHCRASVSDAKASAFIGPGVSQP